MKTSAEKSSTTTSTSAVQAARHPFFTPSLQAKLTVGKRDDLLEREADAAADRVLNRPAALPVRQEKGADWEENEKLRRQAWSGSSTADLQRQEKESAGEPEEKEEVETLPVEREESVQAKSMQGAKDEEPLQAKRAERAVLVLTPAMKSSLAETKGEGSPLPPSVRASMEAGFGIDFEHVRIHTGRSAAELSNELQAEAFTRGSDIYFNQGKYSATTDGQKLLAHELTHVVQQNRSQGVPPKPAHRKLVGEKALEPVELAAPVVAPVHPFAAPAGPQA
ncbi:DUF4157 domain-containing protein, partial [bacterium]|nr:DUF4157 domain-containing protein [bacterium]